MEVTARDDIFSYEAQPLSFPGTKGFSLLLSGYDNDTISALPSSLAKSVPQRLTSYMQEGI